jgi:putative DNA-invertase from lambdoid prophage Rac
METFGYARVSTTRQVSEGESLDVQRLEGYVLMHGLALDDVVVEEGVSGSIPIAERPAGGALFARLAKGDVIISEARQVVPLRLRRAAGGRESEEAGLRSVMRA